MEEIAHIWVVDHTVEMSAGEDHSAWFEEINEDQEEQGHDEVDGTGVRESSEHNLVIRANTIDVNEIIHNDIIDIPEISSEGKIDAPGMWLKGRNIIIFESILCNSQYLFM